MKFGVLAVLIVALSGCASMDTLPSYQDLDWNPARINNRGCPDFSGRYYAPDQFYYDYIFQGRGDGKSLYGSGDIYKRDKDLKIIITISSRTDGILIRADNGRNHVVKFIQYDGVKFGCHGNMLVSRFIIGQTGGAESGQCRSISYGEYHTYLSADGHAVVERNGRARCLAMGRALLDRPPVWEAHGIPVVFLRADDK